MNGFLNVFCAILVLVTTNVFDDVALHVTNLVLGNELHWLNRHLLVVSASLLRVECVLAHVIFLSISMQQGLENGCHSASCCKLPLVG